MVRFIFFCMAFAVLSFVIVPLMSGISDERQEIMAATQDTPAEPPQNSLSFEEIYQTTTLNDPSTLNDIIPAAGEGTIETDSFSSGFSDEPHPALADTPVETEVTGQDSTI